MKGPAESEGKSLAGVLAGKETGVRDSLFTAYTKVQRAVRDDRWKLIVYPQINKTQLFDLKDDPAETKDLADDPAHAADVARMTALLKDWQKKVGRQAAADQRAAAAGGVRFQQGPAGQDRREVTRLRADGGVGVKCGELPTPDSRVRSPGALLPSPEAGSRGKAPAPEPGGRSE